MRSKKIASLVLVLVLALGNVVQPVQAATISSTKKKEQELKNKKAKAQAEQRALSEKLNKSISEMKQAQADVEAKEDEIVKAEDQLIEAKIEEDDQYESMKIRIKYMYENGDVSMLAVLFSAEDMSDFLNKAEYVEQISAYDRQMLVKFQKVVKKVEKKEAELKADRKRLIKSQKNLEKKQKELKKLLASKKAEISNLDSEIGANQKMLKKLIADAEAAQRRREEEASIARNNAANNAANNGGSSSGNSGGSSNGNNTANSGGSETPKPPSVSGSGFLTNPCPAARISSEYGPRRAPVAGASTFHMGRDYAAPRGSAIYAGAAGRVVEASYNSYRGKYVVINHGNGIQTWYQHMTSTYVSVGQQVSKGQNIGTVGNTGISSGPHLHFEVHVNGSPVDPRKYL